MVHLTTELQGAAAALAALSARALAWVLKARSVARPLLLSVSEEPNRHKDQVATENTSRGTVNEVP